VDALSCAAAHFSSKIAVISNSKKIRGAGVVIAIRYVRQVVDVESLQHFMLLECVCSMFCTKDETCDVV